MPQVLKKNPDPIMYECVTETNFILSSRFDYSERRVALNINCNKICIFLGWLEKAVAAFNAIFYYVNLTHCSQ